MLKFEVQNTSLCNAASDLAQPGYNLTNYTSVLPLCPPPSSRPCAFNPCCFNPWPFSPRCCSSGATTCAACEPVTVEPHRH